MEKKSKSVNTKFTKKERFLIGKYTAINGPGAAVRKFRKFYPHLKFGENQERALCKKSLDQEKNGPNFDKEIGILKCGRPLMLESVDEKVCIFLQIIRRKGGAVNSVVAIATTKALIAKSELEHLKALDLSNSLCTKTLFRRMGSVRRVRRTSKPEKPNRPKSEAALILHHKIVNFVKKYQIP